MHAQHPKIKGYRIIRKLGFGGFADVYLAEQTRLRRLVALKVLRNTVEGTAAAQQFTHEAQTIARLEHPHIVRIYDSGIADNGQPYFAMEFVTGGTLRDQHPVGSKVPMAQILTYLDQLVPALQYAHSRGIIHLDLKPQNFLVRENGEVVLSDFGISIQGQPDTTAAQSISYVGTPQYSAPEHLLGKPRKRSDIYSLGIIVYEWLCGELPFNGKTFAAIAMRHIQESPKSLSTIADVKPSIEATIQKALAKDPEHRYVTTSEFLAALQDSESNQIEFVRSKTKEGPRVYSGLGGNVSSVGWSPNKRFLAATSEDDLLRIWDFSSDLLCVTRPLAPGHNVGYKTIWSPDGSHLAVVLSGRVHLWRAGTKPTLMRPPSSSTFFGIDSIDLTQGLRYPPSKPKDYLFDAIWSKDASHMISLHQNTVRAWSIETGDILWANDLQSIEAVTASISPNSEHIMSFDTSYINMCVWDMTGILLWSKTFREIFIAGHNAWSPSSQYIALRSKGGMAIDVYNAKNGATVATCEPIQHGMTLSTPVFSPDDRFLAASSGQTLYVWDVGSGKCLQRHKGHIGDIQCLAWSPDGSYIATGSKDNTIRIWQIF